MYMFMCFHDVLQCFTYAQFSYSYFVSERLELNPTSANLVNELDSVRSFNGSPLIGFGP